MTTNQIKRGDLVRINDSTFVQTEVLSVIGEFKKDVGVVLKVLPDQSLEIKFMHNGLCGCGAGLQGSTVVVPTRVCHIICRDFARRQMNEGDFIGLSDLGFECEESEESDED